jgi:hypothetical protein
MLQSQSIVIKDQPVPITKPGPTATTYFAETAFTKMQSKYQNRK